MSLGICRKGSLYAYLPTPDIQLSLAAALAVDIDRELERLPPLLVDFLIFLDLKKGQSASDL